MQKDKLDSLPVAECELLTMQSAPAQVYLGLCKFANGMLTNI